MKKRILGLFFVTGLFLMLPGIVYAQADPAAISVTICELEEVVLNLFNLIIAITPFIGLAILLYGTVIWMTAAADPQKMQLAQVTLTYGVIGLVLGLSAILIVVTIESFLLSGSGAFRWSEEGGAALIRVQICDEDVERAGPCDNNPCPRAGDLPTHVVCVPNGDDFTCVSP